MFYKLNRNKLLYKGNIRNYIKMNKRLFQILICITSIGILLQSEAIAANYTAKRNKPKEQKQEQIIAVAKCSKQDLRAIKSFNKIAKKQLEEFYIITKALSTTRSPRKSKSMGKEYNKINSFFLSEEFQNMEVIYKNCSKEIPKPETETPFWLPQYK